MTTPDCMSQSPLLNKQWCVRCWPPTHSHSIFDEAAKISACMPYASSLQCYHSNSTYLPTPSPVSCTINRDDRLTAVCVHYGAASKRFHTHTQFGCELFSTLREVWFHWAVGQISLGFFLVKEVNQWLTPEDLTQLCVCLCGVCPPSYSLTQNQRGHVRSICTLHCHGLSFIFRHKLFISLRQWPSIGRLWSAASPRAIYLWTASWTYESSLLRSTGRAQGKWGKKRTSQRIRRRRIGFISHCFCSFSKRTNDWDSKLLFPNNTPDHHVILVLHFTPGYVRYSTAHRGSGDEVQPSLQPQGGLHQEQQEQMNCVESSCGDPRGRSWTPFFRLEFYTCVHGSVRLDLD